MGIRLTVVMFAFNEEDNLRPVVGETLAALEEDLQSGQLEDYQLVLIDDGSRDRTGELIEEIADENPYVTPMSHGTNRGIGAAVKSGFSASRMDYISILPADGQVTVGELRKLYGPINDGADMALGYYTQRGDVDGLFRLTLSRGLRKMMAFFLGTQRQMDGVYMFRRSMLKVLPLKSETFFVNLELPVRAIREQYDVRSVPVTVHARRSGSSKVLGLNRIAKVGGEVVRFRWNLVREALDL